MPEYKNIETKLTCPKCKEGKVTLVISKKDGKEYKFFRCSEYDCNWNGGFYNQDVEKLDLIENCPSCDGVLYPRKGKNRLFLGCSHFPKCKFTKNFNENKDKEIENKSAELTESEITKKDFKNNINVNKQDFKVNEEKNQNKNIHAAANNGKINNKQTIYERFGTDLKCPKCGKENVVLVIKTTDNREKKFFRCTEDDCNWNGGFYNRNEIKLDNLEHCPNCKGILYERIGKNGSFMACSNFPRCKFTHDVIKNEDLTQENHLDEKLESKEKSNSLKSNKKSIKEKNHNKQSKNPQSIENYKKPEDKATNKEKNKENTDSITEQSENSPLKNSQNRNPISKENLDYIFKEQKGFKELDQDYSKEDYNKIKQDYSKEDYNNIKQKQDYSQEDYTKILQKNDHSKDYEILDQIEDTSQIRLINNRFAMPKIEKKKEKIDKAEYDEFRTKLLCPNCQKGQVILIRNKKTKKGFFRCTNNKCNWDGGPYNKPLKQLKYITYCTEPGCKGINYHTTGKYGPFKACTWFVKTDCKPKKK